MRQFSLREKNIIDAINLVDVLRLRNQNQADNIAFIFLPNGEISEEVRLTYQELDKKARAIAALLQNFNVKSERALLLYQPGLEFITAFFGCLYAGVVAVPVYPPRKNYHSNRLQAIVVDATATIALTTTSILNNHEKSLKEESCLKTLHYITTDDIDSNKASAWQPIQLDQLNLLSALQ